MGAETLGEGGGGLDKPKSVIVRHSFDKPCYRLDYYVTIAWFNTVRDVIFVSVA